MEIAESLREQMIAHALRDAPNECCGLVAVSPGAVDGEAGAAGGGTGAVDGETRAVKVYAAENVAASPLRFEIDGLDVYRLIEEIEQEGLELGAIYHSHTRTAPYPSQTDINFAANWPGVHWVIIGVADRERPEVRTFLIDGAEVRETSTG